MRISPAIVFLLLYLILSGGCASMHPTIPMEQIGINDAEQIISEIKEQNDMVRSFYALGVVSIKGSILDADADILIAGNRDPFTIKIEITHTWGKPILHILIKGGRLDVLSFQEKLAYTCTFTPEALSIFLSGFILDQEMIWSILSGRPPVMPHDTVSVSSPDRISLTDDRGIEIEAIYLPLEGSLPKKVAFPEQSLNIFFYDMKEQSSITYAGKIKTSGKKIERDLALEINTISFNASIPDQIFALEIPSSYKIVNLDDTQVDYGK